MVYRSQRQALRALRETAAAQGGYFTAKQAEAAGYDYPHLIYHLKVGNFERVQHGLYRLVGYPPADHDDLVRLALWSRDRHGSPQAVVSHQTALGLHELADLIPTEIHLTVPRHFRKAAPKGVVLHKADLPPGDQTNLGGVTGTTAARTLSDLAADPSLSREQHKTAIEEALRRGLLKASEAHALRPAAKDARASRPPRRTRR